MAEPDAPIYVLSVPLPIPENPYQRLLHEALSMRGVEIQAERPGVPAIRRHSSGLRVLHVHWIWLKSGHIARRWRALRARRLLREAKRQGWTIVWTVHNLLPHDGTPLDLRLRNDLLSLAGGLIAHTAASRREILEATAFQGPVAVIPHGHYRDAYPPAPDRAECRRALGWQGGVPVFLAFGQIRPYKGLDRLVAALRQSSLDARLHIAGAPSDRAHAAAIRRLAGGDPRITIDARQIPDSEVPLLFGASDRVALPFRRITTSGALCLALTFGRPVLIPDVPTLREAAGPEAARVFGGDRDLPEALAACIEDDQRVADAAAWKQGDALDWGPIAEATIHLYRAAAGGSPTDAQPKPYL